MDWASFGIALAGLLSTSIVSAIGIYFTHKARTQNYRDLLYEKQLELVVELMEIAQLMQLEAGLVVDVDGGSQREIYRDAFNEHYLEFRKLERRGTVLLPVELYGAVKEVLESASSVAIKISDAEETIEAVQSLITSNARLGLVARRFMGVDALSTQSRRLFPNEKDMEKVEVDVKEMAELVAKAQIKKSQLNENSEVT